MININSNYTNRDAHKCTLVKCLYCENSVMVTRAEVKLEIKSQPSNPMPTDFLTMGYGEHSLFLIREQGYIACSAVILCAIT